MEYRALEPTTLGNFGCVDDTNIHARDNGTYSTYSNTK